jgi:hypothetical protein
MRGRAIARPSCDYTVDTGGNIVDNNDNNGEFDQFSFLFLEFSLEILIFHVVSDLLLAI